MLRYVMPVWATIAVDVVAWGVFHAGTGYAAHRLDGRRLAEDGWLLRPRGVKLWSLIGFCVFVAMGAAFGPPPPSASAPAPADCSS